MIKDTMTMKKKWTIRRYRNEQDFLAGKLSKTIMDAEGKILPGKSVFEGNVMLNEGIGEHLLLLSGGAATAFSNATAHLGVGDSTTIAAATQTGLQASTNKLYKAMENGYPSISGQTITFRSVFTGTDANYAWQEFTIANGTDDSAVNLNRKVDDQGTKASGQTWTIDLAITFS